MARFRIETAPFNCRMRLSFETDARDDYFSRRIEAVSSGWFGSTKQAENMLSRSSVLANAQHIRNVSGRKTDVNDATWIAELLAHGLIRLELCAAATDSGAARSELADLAPGRNRCSRAEKT